ncbi:MAG: hypothetical protein ACTSSF_07795 [Candidatus Heimdallarchaeaceae archaeon]
MSGKKQLGKVISKGLRTSFLKWFAIGIGAAIVIGSIVGVSVYFTLPNGTPTPDTIPSEPYSTRLATSILGAIDYVLHLEIGGNASGFIDDRMIWSSFDRVGTEEDYYWNASATLINPYEEVSFTVSKEEISEIAQALFDSINKTQHLGTWGEDPYETGGEAPDMKWITEMYLENGTAIFLYVNMESLILFQSTTWTGNFQANINMIGSAVLSPESAFDDYVQVMANLFAPYT